LADTLQPSALRIGLHRRAGLAFALGGQVRLLVGLAIAGGAALAYHLTLADSLQNLQLGAPASYLALVPFVAIWAAWEATRRYRGAAPPIRDRQLDVILGLPLLLAALFLITVIPVTSGPFYWALRLDMLSLALFVIAAVVLTCGVGWAWRMRAPLVVLLLTWPVLYIGVLTGLATWFARSTDGVLTFFTTHLALGVSRVPGHPSLLAVHPTSGSTLHINVGASSAGGADVLGFLIVGGAVLLLVSGPVRGRLLWLGTGLLLSFVLNVDRILSVALLAKAGHPAFAAGGFAQLIGLLLLAASVALMVWLLPSFGLSRLGNSAGDNRRESSLASQRSGWESWRTGLSSKRGARVVQLALVALALGVFVAADQSLALYAGFDNGRGVPTVTAVTSGTKVPQGWHLSLVGTEPWARQYFGHGSSFARYALTHAGPGSNHAVLSADVITTRDAGTLQTYNMENSFLFHEYDIETTETVALGHGVTGLLLNYASTGHSYWASLSWDWPVRVAGATAYERIVLSSPLVSNSVAKPKVQPTVGLGQSLVIAAENLFTSDSGRSDSPAMYHDVDALLQTFGTEFLATSTGPAVGDS
jgi:exosortase/archaeosortase family protein